MPSWRTHRIIGDIVCGFSDSKIDELIDIKYGHDSSRYDPAVLNQIANEVYSKHGEKGICYLVLHHFLDRFNDIITSELAKAHTLYESRKININEAYGLIKRKLIETMLTDKSNLLSAFSHDFKTAFEASIYFHLRKRGRGIRITDLLELGKRPPIGYDTVKMLIRATVKVVDNIKNNLDRILLLLLTDKINENTADYKIRKFMQQLIAHITNHT